MLNSVISAYLHFNNISIIFSIELSLWPAYLTSVIRMALISQLISEFCIRTYGDTSSRLNLFDNCPLEIAFLYVSHRVLWAPLCLVYAEVQGRSCSAVPQSSCHLRSVLTGLTHSLLILILTQAWSSHLTSTPLRLPSFYTCRTLTLSRRRLFRELICITKEDCEPRPFSELKVNPIIWNRWM